MSCNVCLFSGEKCLFASSEDRNREKTDEEDRNSGRKIDIIWSMKPTDLEFSVGEVSEWTTEPIQSYALF